jgi:hypothetical protein
MMAMSAYRCGGGQAQETVAAMVERWWEGGRGGGWCESMKNVSVGWAQMERNNGRLHNSTGTVTGATRNLELLVKE